METEFATRPPAAPTIGAAPLRRENVFELLRRSAVFVTLDF